MTSFRPYEGHDYLDADGVDAFLDHLAEAAPDWVEVQVIGHARGGRPIRLVTVGATDGPPAADRPAFWLDGGTHATEWTGVMSCLFTLSRWVGALLDGDATLRSWFREHVAFVVPCISPDGLQATVHGTPAFRSTLRPPRASTVRQGFEAWDLTGDGQVRWMRWKHPAGSWVPVEGHALAMRPRTVDDDPADAWFLAPEGRIVDHDGTRWVQAPLQHGLDLNRNFPVDWSPFSMFGMDAGDFPGSEPESRALLDAVAQRPNIAAGVTNHTFTGCLLAPPGRKDTPIGAADLQLMQRLAHDAVEGTGYRVYKVYPEFMYDPEKPIIGTWDDTLQSTFGIVAYTLELWDPYTWAGKPVDKPVDMWSDPDPAVMEALVDQAVREGAYQPWTPFHHPQLGDIEVGGIDDLRTVRNPPTALLPAECERGFTVADRIRRALPRVEARLHVERDGDLAVVTLELENLGALSTASLKRAEQVGTAPAVRARVVASDGQSVVHGPVEQELPHLDGWFKAGFDRSSLYPSLGARGNRAVARWTIRGGGEVTVAWQAGRAGRGEVSA